MCMVAPSATIRGGRWFVGSFEQTLPPIVPRFRTWTSAICAHTSPRIGRARASADSISSVYVTIAPIDTVPSDARSIPLRSASLLRSMRTSGEAARAFMTLIRVWPPARARAPSCSESRRTASWTLAGRAYSTSLNSIRYSEQNRLHRSRNKQSPHAGTLRGLQRRPDRAMTVVSDERGRGARQSWFARSGDPRRARLRCLDRVSGTQLRRRLPGRLQARCHRRQGQVPAGRASLPGALPVGLQEVRVHVRRRSLAEADCAKATT